MKTAEEWANEIYSRLINTKSQDLYLSIKNYIVAIQNDALETIETKTKEKFIKLHGMSVRGRAYNEACNDIIDDVKNLKNNI